MTGKTDEYIPEIGTEGSVYGNLPQTGGAGEHVPQTGVAGADDPAEIVAKALLCFNDNYVSDISIMHIFLELFGLNVKN